MRAFVRIERNSRRRISFRHQPSNVLKTSSSRTFISAIPTAILRLFVVLDLRLVTQDCVQQRTMNFNFSIVTDEAPVTKFVHKEAHPRPGRTDHFRQCFLTEGDRDSLRDSLLAEICEKQEKPCEPSFAGIE